MSAAPEPSTPVEIRRSARRRRTVSAYRDGDRIIVLVPARLSRAEEARLVGEMVRRVEAKTGALGDEALQQRARRLAQRYLGGLAHPQSVRWVTNQRTRWGSCTPLHGTIRLSHRLQGMPDYVIDYVLLHELAHLLQPDHSKSFWTLLGGYPQVQRARGFLEGAAYASGAEMDDDDTDDDTDDGAGVAVAADSATGPRSGPVDEAGSGPVRKEHGRPEL